MPELFRQQDLWLERGRLATRQLLSPLTGPTSVANLHDGPEGKEPGTESILKMKSVPELLDYPILSEKKVRKLSLGRYPFKKKKIIYLYLFIPKGCIIVPRRYIFVPKWYILVPFEKALPQRELLYLLYTFSHSNLNKKNYIMLNKS